MKQNTFWLVVVGTLVITIALMVNAPRFANAQEVASSASEQSKYTLKVPGGLAFSEFRGYED